MHAHNSSQTFSHLHLSKEQGFCYLASMCRASLVAQTVKNLSAMWESWVRSLSWKDPLEEGLATHSSILAWRIPWTVTKSWTQLSDIYYDDDDDPECKGVQAKIPDSILRQWNW